ncbi:hypothetical protein BDV40DRAFT_271965 [Aspergillus tamarii]|uniref:Uncharacterized protein n=1 Tax=Aspergillus tamarii TaxID=41984 RepID=A0A5N6UN42_ASPTM|nr:hypothetical protein BDV40DRAFT_271965 [Aspergillus tamarii]
MPRFVSRRVEAKTHRGYRSATQRSLLGDFPPLLRLPARSILLLNTLFLSYLLLLFIPFFKRFFAGLCLLSTVLFGLSC